MRVHLLFVLMVMGADCFAQKFIAEAGTVSFYSEAPVEDIEAVNHQITSIFDSDSGQIVFLVPIKHFEFDKPLMKEHFNENYMESEKYPKSTFKGKLEGYEKKEGVQHLRALGDLTIHGVTRQVEFPGTLEMKDGTISIKAKFSVRVADYEIEIPSLLFQDIAEVVEVTLNINYKLYEK